MKISYKCLYMLLFVSCFFISCVSKKNIIENGALCGIVVDENNKPIPNYIVYCFKNAGNKQSTVTNESGIFIFPDKELGTYSIEGEKENYTKLNMDDYNFYNCSNLFCVQVMSFKECLKKVNSFISANDYTKCKILLEDVCVKAESTNEALLLCYLIYSDYMLGDTDKCRKNIKKLKKLNIENCNAFINSLEELIND